MELNVDLDLCRSVGESADRLVSTQVFMSGGAAELTTRNMTRELYEAAQRRHGEPLSYLAAKKLIEVVKPRSTVVLSAGFFDPPSMIDEADGPLGVALLARSLCVAFDAVPVIVTELANVKRMEALVAATGLEVVKYELAKTTPFKASVVPLPIDPDRARKTAREIVEKTAPVAMVCVEKPSPSPEGRYHTGLGLDVTDVLGKIDHVVEAISESGAVTIGIGDGGNEVGMGGILDDVREIVPTGKKIGSAVATDILVVSTIANWGSYAIEACIAAALHMPEALHALADERRVTEAAARAGFIDPSSGAAHGWVDGTPPICSESILELLRQMVDLRLARKRPQSLSNFPKRWAERGAAVETIAVWAKHLKESEDAYFAENGDITL